MGLFKMDNHPVKQPPYLLLKLLKLFIDKYYIHDNMGNFYHRPLPDLSGGYCIG
jgi:hypothetical protein